MGVFEPRMDDDDVEETVMWLLAIASLTFLVMLFVLG